jgi:hypothetical protein
MTLDTSAKVGQDLLDKSLFDWKFPLPKITKKEKYEKVRSSNVTKGA